MAAVPNLYLKWRVFRAMFPDDRADADFAGLILVDDEPAARPAKFSKLLYGDVGCKPRVAEHFVKVINDGMVAHLDRHEPPPGGTFMLSVGDLLAPLYEFTRRLVAAAGKIDAGALDRVHAVLLESMAPWMSQANRPPNLRVERAGERFGWVQSSKATEFEAGDLGRFTVEGLSRDPVAAYVLATRDPSVLGQRLWDLEWEETILWLPSPFVPVRRGGVLALTEPETVRPMFGRFLVTAVLVMNAAVQAKLDPRGKFPPKGALDELQTARFLTNVRRLGEANPGAVTIAANEYVVRS